MPIKIPTTSKVEEIAQDMDLFSFQIDKDNIAATIEFGNITEGKFNQFELRSFYANHSNLKALLESRVLAGLLEADKAVEIKADIEFKANNIKEAALELLIDLHTAGLINIPEKVSRWVEPKSTS